MALSGPGKYDDEATLVRETTKADLVMLMVVNGTKGNGFSVQVVAEQSNLLARLPYILRGIASDIEEDLKSA